MIKRLFQVEEHNFLSSVAILFVRYVFGTALAYHGWGKFQNPFAWMPADGPMHAPGIFQFLSAFSEFGGGIAIILGLVIPLTTFGIMCNMTVAMYLHIFILKQPFVSLQGTGSYELAAVYFSLAFLLLFIGPGKISIDRVIFGARRKDISTGTG